MSCILSLLVDSVKRAGPAALVLIPQIIPLGRRIHVKYTGMNDPREPDDQVRCERLNHCTGRSVSSSPHAFVQRSQVVGSPLFENVAMLVCWMDSSGTGLTVAALPDLFSMILWLVGLVVSVVV